jgi:phytoene dehydrogenase-like protein
LNIIPHLEFGLGAYLQGGMHEITNSLVKLAKEIGLNFNQEVTAIETEKTW